MLTSETSRTGIANLRAELKSDISNLQKSIVNLMLSSVALSVHPSRAKIQRLID